MRNLIATLTFLLLCAAVPLLAAEAESTADEVRPDECWINFEKLCGIQLLLLKPISFETSLEYTNDSLEEKKNGKLSSNRTAIEAHKFTLKYEISFFDFYRSFSPVFGELPKVADDPKKEKDILSAHRYRIFFDSIKFTGSGGWSNTGSDIHDALGLTVKSNNQFTGKVNVSFKMCAYELFVKRMVGCTKK